MKGVNVYRRDDIPDEYNYKNGRYVQEILVCAKPGDFNSSFRNNGMTDVFFLGYIISGADSPKQVPRDPPVPRPMIWNGLHGYDSSHPDMR